MSSYNQITQDYSLFFAAQTSVEYKMLSCEKVEAAKLTKSLKPIENHEIVDDYYIDPDTECGFGIIRGKWIQKLASKKTFLIFHAFTGMIYGASFHYYSGILTTLEKQFKFSSAQMGYIGSLYDVVATIVSLIMPYYCSRGSRRFPRWMGFSLFCLGISFIVNLLPAVIYDPSDDILSLTKEYDNVTVGDVDFIYERKMKELCYSNRKSKNILNQIG